MQNYLVFLSLLVCTSLSAQYDHISVFSDLDGTALYDALVDNYKPASTLSFNNSRDTMFAVIYERNDSVVGFYTGYQKYLDPNVDPTTVIYENGGSNGMNTEHCYPRSKGAEAEPGKSDLHHLFPTRSVVNSARGSFEFDEVNDQQTNKWYINNTETTNVPNQNIDGYSEVGEGKFEPRESVKGNVARAVFYFYTMYRTQAENADPVFFENQREVLCDWHYLDPVDQLEWERNYLIANYQDGKVNPFILDCSLAARLYCGEVDPGCKTVNVPDLEKQEVFVQAVPNPSNGNFEFRFQLDNNYQAEINIHNILGKLILTERVTLSESENKVSLSQQLNPGNYFYNISLVSGKDVYTITDNLIIE